MSRAPEPAPSPGKGSTLARRARMFVVGLLQVAVSGAILVALLRMSNWEEVKTTFVHVDPSWLSLAVGMLVLQQFINALRWRTISCALGGPRLRASFYMIWQGMAVLLLQVLPSTIGGDVLRAASGARHDGLQRGVGVVVVDRVIGMAMLCVIVFVGGVAMRGALVENLALLTPVGMSILGLGGCAVVMSGAAILSRYRLTAPFAHLGRALRTVLRGQVGLRVGGASLGIHLMSVVAVLCLLLAVRAPNIDPLRVFFVIPAAFLVASIPISLGGWGIREGAFVVGLGLLGSARETALGVSVLFGLSLTAAGLVLTAVGALLWAVSLLRQREESTDAQ